MTQLETTDWLYGTISTNAAGDLISDCIHAYGEWARTEVEFICKYLLPHQGTFIDIGAYIGTHTIPFALHVGPCGNGISFEPNRSSFSLLSVNLQMAGLKNVTAYNTAASESSGIAFNLFSEPGNNGQTTLHREAASYNPSDTDSNKCLGQAIDDLHIGHVDFIKVDVEGMEFSALKGCIKLVEHCKPNIYLELNSLEEHAFVFDFAKKFDYDIYGVRTLAFNASNYKKNLSNETLRTGAELGVVLTTQNLPSIGNNPDEALIVQRLNDLDELIIFLLSKPQYRARLSKGLLQERLRTPDYLSTTSTAELKMALANEQTVREETEKSRDTLAAELNRILDSEQQARLMTAQVQSLLDKTKSDLNELRAILEKTEQSKNALLAKLNCILESESQARVETAQMQSLFDKTVSDLNDLRALLQEAEQSRDSLLAQLNEIKASRSWAITSPYRKFASYIRDSLR